MFYIAEIGLNHNGDLDLAKNMVTAARKAGADAVKFQSIQASSLVSPKTFDKPVNGFGLSEVNNIGDFWNKISIGEGFHREIKKYCDKIDIEFMSTPFDKKSADLLEELEVRRFKIASGDLTNYPLIEHVLQKNRPVLLSTGGANITEIKQVVNFIGKTTKTVDLTLMHCVSLYPTPPELANLKAIDHLRNLFNCPIGFSDHTLGFHIPLAAIARGAKIIEKHFTIDQELPGPDQKISATPDIFSKIVKYGNQISSALQPESKRVSEQEKKELTEMRRSIVAARNLESGEVITEEDLDFKRPARGISPTEYKTVIGCKVLTDIEKDEPIRWSMLNDKK